MNEDVTEKEVAEFLKANPSFFENRDSLLMKMSVPHSSKGAVSLVEKQMTVMRERQKKTTRQLNEFVKNAELNKAIFDKSSQLILGLLGTNRSSEFFSALEKGLKRDFKCKAYALVIFGKARQINHFTSRVPAESAREYVGALMRARQPTLGVLRPDEQDFLFRHQSDKVKSAAVLSVKDRNKQVALLAIGSDDPDYFANDMDTLFLGFIADVLAKLLPRHLPR